MEGDAPKGVIGTMGYSLQFIGGLVSSHQKFQRIPAVPSLSAMPAAWPINHAMHPDHPNFEI